VPAPSGRHGSFNAKILGGENVKNKIKKIAVVALALISVLVVSILPCSAVSVPNYNITDDEYTHYTVVSYDFGTEFVFLSNCELAVLQTSNMSYVNNPNGYWVKKIQLHENYSAEVNDGTLCSWSPGQAQIVSANYDVKFQGTDKVFFQQPTLLSQLLSLVPGAGEKITGDLGTLMVCGVACLALLIGLSLLPKVLYKFL
jgi:hypothetical protein